MPRANFQHNGFRYWGSVFAENVAPRVTPCQVATGYATGIFKGDPVKRLADGSVAVAIAGDPIFGVSMGAKYRNADGVLVEKDFLPASTTYPTDLLRSIVMVVPATPFTIFEVDGASAVTTVAIARTMVWENCDHLLTIPGNTATGLSGAQLDITTHATTASQWRIWDLSPIPVANDPTQVLAKYLVIANKTHNWPGTFSTTGI